ncbi:cysteine protease StiP domain-containing protein [Sphingomonas sp. 3-13AW]|uniref:cysteine protease StiP domain-containing protein n=1 Tax=Sphingomonas sp. 3-13AW TaxID=3050450 RepID=UPI003BB4B12C
MTAPNDPSPVFSGSYSPEDVTFLLKPLAVDYTDVEEKERLIQSGERHYSEMISIEQAPDSRYLDLYERAMDQNGIRLARDLVSLAKAIARTVVPQPGSAGIAVVSLARAGTPIGALIHRHLKLTGYASRHYSISIIRDRGVDLNALARILRDHAPSDIVFVDGWTGKGAITRELHSERGPMMLGVRPTLAVVADPAGCADLAASGDDYVIPSGILNGIVSGLISRSVLNEQIGPDDFHGTVYLEHLADEDVSQNFLDRIWNLMLLHPGAASNWLEYDRVPRREACIRMLEAIRADSGVSNENNIKPGIAEATRAVLRRVPDKLYLSDPDDVAVEHLVHLARQKGIAIDRMPVETHYRAATVIRSASAE